MHKIMKECLDEWGMHQSYYEHPWTAHDSNTSKLHLIFKIEVCLLLLVLPIRMWQVLIARD